VDVVITEKEIIWIDRKGTKFRAQCAGKTLERHPGG
jgi:hypothetical protein